MERLDQRFAQEAVLRPEDWIVDDTLREQFQLDHCHLLIVGGGEFAGLDAVLTGMGRHPEQPVTGDALLACGVAPNWSSLWRS